MAKSKSKDAPPSFEEAIDQLDEIVQAMEGDQLSLSELIDQYAKGMSLEKLCRDQLTVARQRVETIAESVDGELETVPFEPDTAEDADVEKPKARKQKSELETADDDEIRLF